MGISSSSNTVRMRCFRVILVLYEVAASQLGQSSAAAVAHMPLLADAGVSYRRWKTLARWGSSGRRGARCVTQSHSPLMRTIGRRILHVVGVPASTCWGVLGQLGRACGDALRCTSGALEADCC
jgi:hypothetical protein